MKNTLNISSNKYGSKFIQKFYAGSFSSSTFYHGSIARIVCSMNIREGSKILDIGCGSGVLLNSIRSDCLRVGIDSAENMIRLSREVNPNLKTLVGDLNHIPLKNIRFDFILSRAVLQHLHKNEHQIFFSEARNLLAEHGKLIIFLPVNSKLMRLPRALSEILVKERRKISGTMYPVSYLKEIIHKSGLTIENEFTYGFLFYIISGYGTGISLPIQNQKLWTLLEILDRWMVKLPIIKSNAINWCAILKKSV